MLRLRELVVRRAESVDDVPRKEGGKLVKADDARVFADAAADVVRAARGGAGHDGDGRLRRVVAVFHARRARLFAGGDLPGHGAVDRDLAEHGAQALERQSTGAQQARRRDRQVDDRALDADGTAAAVDDGVDLAVHVLEHVLRGGGAGTAGGVAAGRGDGNARRGDDAQRRRVVRAAHADRRQTRRRLRGNDIAAGEDHRQRAGPEALREQIRLRRHVMAVPLEPRGVRNVDDEGVVLRTALGLKDVPHGLAVEGVRTQTVDRLRRDADEPAAAENVGGRLGGLRIGIGVQ